MIRGAQKHPDSNPQHRFFMTDFSLPLTSGTRARRAPLATNAVQRRIPAPLKRGTPPTIQRLPPPVSPPPNRQLKSLTPPQRIPPLHRYQNRTGIVFFKNTVRHAHRERERKQQLILWMSSLSDLPSRAWKILYWGLKRKCFSYFRE